MIKKLSMALLVLSLFACSDSKNTEVKNAVTNSAATNAATTTPATMGVEKFTEGTHYTVIKTPIATYSDKIVVTEFFWYACPHCEKFEPVLATWDKKKPADVILKKSPAVWQEAMQLHARLFFLVQTLPNRDFVHSALFAEIIPMHSEPSLAVQNQKIIQFLSKFGVSEADYTHKMQSLEVDAQLKVAMDLMQKSGVSGTPAIMVNGKYLVNNEGVSSMEQILEIADFLIEKERQNKAK